MKRSEQKKENTWNLEAMYDSQEKWLEEYAEALSSLTRLELYKGHLADSPDVLFNALEEIRKITMNVESLCVWASLQYESDAGDASKQKNAGLASSLSAAYSEAVSWFDPEVMAIEKEKLEKWLSEDRFSEYRIFMSKLLRMKEHTLSAAEERLLSLNTEASSACQDAFHDLNDVDLDFGFINNEKLTQSSFRVFIQDKDENIRKEAYEKLYRQYEKHQHVIAKLYAGSVNQDIFQARARGYSSSLEAALYPDDVPQSVYDNLIDAVHESFPVLHRYYRLRAKLLRKEKLRHYDVYLPMVADVSSVYTYDEAVELIKKAVSPLGKEYTDILVKGLTEDRWVDRYENEGKRSGAFSSGAYTSMPYILTNYKDDILDSVFTLIHEGGHSMHSYYSARNNPFMHYEYSIFEAEVASTFNEELLSRYLIASSSDDRMKAYLIASRLDDIVATLFRQTMFAEFEKKVHEEVENGGVATFDYLRKTYRSLLEAYFGPDVEFEEYSDLECFRIPHFYNAFYVYKYSTGICAAIALVNRVLEGGEKEREEYLSFLKRGGSMYPIGNLKAAGVDMSGKESVKSAIGYFSRLLCQLEELTE